MATQLPTRSGGRPTTTPTTPHIQLDQQPTDGRINDMILSECQTWPHVEEHPSGISVEGARALVLGAGSATGPEDSFLVGREFAHAHARGDFSFHMTLPSALAAAAIDTGWAEHHVLVEPGEVPPTFVMLYAPRDASEVAVVIGLLQASYLYATAASTDPSHPFPPVPARSSTPMEL